MSLAARNAICKAFTPSIQIKRFRGKINIQKPKPPHFERAKYLALAKPWFLPQDTDKKRCGNLKKLDFHKQKEENPFQRILSQELYRWFKTSKLVAFCHYNPMTKDDEYKAYMLLHKEKMHFKKYGKETLEMAVKGTPYEAVLDFYVSHNITIFSPEPEIKKLLKILRRFPQLILLAGIYENKLISKEELVYYSNIPNIQAAQATLVQTLNSAGTQLVSNLNSHQSTLVSHIDQRANQLQKGE
ncbi:39S ribosomal protein L10, mitochondrial [Sitophilus oryzae]|uniref:Large ribosomal subunit protein uL10m n=1 Tax=Sitophilus oryzae TaxID=7048 RepID=A0A6J2YN69_SITOR|nr:39S ribosomal protein L10, mitochondrial [Sitophilus oryzae]